MNWGEQTVTKIVYWLALMISLSHITINYFVFIPESWSGAIHFALFCSLGAFVYFKRPLFQIGVALMAVCASAYFIFLEDALYARGQNFIFSDYLFSSIAIVIGLLVLSRMIGWFIPILILASLTYIWLWGRHVPGVFNFPGLSLESLLFRSYFSSDGMFGPIAQISWTFVFMFVLFGAFLQVSGAGDYLLHISFKLTSRLRGGAGLVAVLGSGAMGSISGSAIANTAATGVVTIPAMKKAGFSKEFSAGVEAAASTGGQLMPPIMGAGAFIMASYTQLPYVQIISAALLPAILYYITVMVFVRSYAIKHRLPDIELPESSSAGKYKNAWRHLVPIATLVFMLIAGFTPLYGAAAAILVIIALSWISEKPLGIREVCEALVSGAKGMTVTAVLLVCIGLLVNAIVTSGVGNTFSLMAIDWSGGSLLVLIALIAIASLILGAGLPVTASYIIVATLLAPILADLITVNYVGLKSAAGESLQGMETIALLVPDVLQDGVLIADKLLELDVSTRQVVLEMALSKEALASTLLAAHLIIFWLSQDSNVTPPVCLVAYTAAGIAGASHNRSALYAWKLAKGLYVIPLLMAYSAIITGSLAEIMYVFIVSAFGLVCIIWSWEGVVNDPVGKYTRITLGIAGLTLLYPSTDIILSAIILLSIVLYLLKNVITRGFLELRQSLNVTKKNDFFSKTSSKSIKTSSAKTIVRTNSPTSMR